MTNELRMVAVYKDKDNYVSLVCGKLDKVTTDCQLYEAMGYNLDSCIITNDKDIYIRSKLKARVLELREYTKMIEAYEKEHDLSDLMCQLTLKLMREHEETIMRQVSICVTRCLLRDIEVTDELAIQCYNFRREERGF